MNPHLVELTPSLESSIKGVLETILLVYKTFGYQPPQNNDLTGTIKTWAIMVNELNGDWMKVAKYKIAAFYSYHNNQRMPPKPFKAKDNAKFLLGSKASRWQHNILSGDEVVKESFLQSILQSKKGMPRPGMNYLLKAKEDLIKDLGSKREEKKISIDWATLDSIEEDTKRHLDENRTEINKINMEIELRRTVQEVFGGQKVTDKQRMQPFFPSTSANYNNSRTTGGAIGTIMKHPKLLEGLRKAGGLLVKQPTLIYKEEVNKEGEGYTEITFDFGTQVDTTEFEIAYITLYHRLLEEALREVPVAVAVALPEALKVRVITKGPPLRQTVLRNINKFLHNILRKHSTFSLVGTPVTEKIILDVMGKNLLDYQYYLSGDYAAATNEIQSWISDIIADEIVKVVDMNEEEGLLYKESLTQHIIEKTTKEGKDIKWSNSEKNEKTKVIEEIEGMSNKLIRDKHKEDLIFRGKFDKYFIFQENGQLMGSITSFVVLCIANAAMCRWAYELSEARQNIKLVNIPMLINGDDCCIKGRWWLKECWNKITEFGGLAESIGKTYFSKKFLNINSLSFLRREEEKTVEVITKENMRMPGPLDELDSYALANGYSIGGRAEFDDIAKGGYIGSYEVERKSHLHVVKYLNLGLLKGIKRSGISTGLNDEDDSRSNMSTRVEQMLEMSPDWMHGAIMKEFMYFNKEILDKTRLPWFIPTWLGGLGIRPGIWGGPSDKDRSLARLILQNWSKVRPVAIGQGKIEWKTWIFAGKAIGKSEEVENKEDEEIFKTIVGLKCIDLLFDSNYSLEKLHVEAKEGAKVSRAIKKNSKLWQPSNYKNLPGREQWVTDEELLYKSKYSGIKNLSLIVGEGGFYSNRARKELYITVKEDEGYAGDS